MTDLEQYEQTEEVVESKLEVWVKPGGSCTCTDVELGITDPLLALRGGVKGAAMPVPPLVVDWIATDIWSGTSWRGPPVRRVDDPGGRYSLALVRSTRLNV